MDKSTTPKSNPKSKQEPELIILSSDNEPDYDEIEVENVGRKEDGSASKESDAIIETDPSKKSKSDNIVLQKRGPRYFDPLDNSLGNCNNCGESGHSAEKCTSAKRNKGKHCVFCKKGGHRAKDCPEKSNQESQRAKFCLNCGDSGHEMFSCKSMYSLDELKEIQCYVCKCFGHLCCTKYAVEGSRKISCYRCGQLGHSGLECARVHAEKGSNWTPSSCMRCGKESHTACKCTAASKSDSGFLSSKKKNKKRKRSGGKTQPSLSQHQPSAYNHNHNYNYNHGWGSPMTPAMHIPNASYQFQFHGGNGYNSSYNNSSGFHNNQGMFNGYNNHRFSVPWFGNFSNARQYPANQRGPNGHNWWG